MTRGATRLLLTVLVAFILSFAGWLSAGIYTHGPDIFWVVAVALIPGALLVPHVTGAYVGESRLSFALFVLVQLAYYHLLLGLPGLVRRAASRGR